jgi:hypothetical protein
MAAVMRAAASRTRMRPHRPPHPPAHRAKPSPGTPRHAELEADADAFA